MTNRLFNFVGGETGSWRVVRMDTIAGAPLERVSSLEIINGQLDSLPAGGEWVLRGVTSYERYVIREERDSLTARQPSLCRSEATCAALIPISKSSSWWELAQDERRAIFETRSEHIKTGLKYLPAIARRLHHCRDLTGEEFDFLTWFEYAPSDEAVFEQLARSLRASEEWNYVEREIDIRLVRGETAAT
ncbi:MAG: chlorite dismutase family protein [Acidobacteriota bacterium]|nr:chlorite dismutase family protein [Acidobacteriota bacterium]